MDKGIEALHVQRKEESNEGRRNKSATLSIEAQNGEDDDDDDDEFNKVTHFLLQATTTMTPSATNVGR